MANVTGLNTADMASYLTATLYQFGLQANEAVSVVNRLNAVDNEFSVTSLGLAQSIAKSGEAAQVAGVSLDELLAMTTVIGEKTRESGTVIGNSLKNVFARLNSEKAQKALESINVSITDSFGVMKSATQIYGEVAQKWDVLSKSQKMYISESLAGKYHLTRMLALLDGYGKMTQIVNVSQNSYNSALEENQKHMQSLEAHYSMLQAAGQELAFTIGEGGLKDAFIGLLHIITDVVKGMTTIVEVFNGWPGKLLATATAVGALVYGLSKLRDVLDAVAMGAKMHPLMRLATIAATAVSGFALLSGVIGDNVRDTDELNKQNERLINTYNEQRGTVSDLVQKHQQYANAVQNGAKLNPEQEKEWKDIQNELNQMLPNLTERIKENGDAVIKRGDALNKELEYIQQLNREYQERAEIMAKDKFEERSDKAEAVQKQIDKIKGIINNNGIDVNYNIFDALTFKNAAYSKDEIKAYELQLLSLEKELANLNAQQQGTMTNLIENFAKANDIDFTGGISDSVAVILDQLESIKDKKSPEELQQITTQLKGFTVELDKLYKTKPTNNADNLKYYWELFKKLEGTIPNVSQAYMEWTKTIQQSENASLISPDAIGGIDDAISKIESVSSELDVYKKAQVELYTEGEVSQETTHKLIKANSDYADIMNKGQGAISEFLQAEIDHRVKGLEKNKKATEEAIRLSRERMTALINETTALKGLTEEEAVKTAASVAGKLGIFKVEHPELWTPELQKEFDKYMGFLKEWSINAQQRKANEDALKLLENEAKQIGENADLTKKKEEDAEKAAKDREKAEKDAQKAAEESRKKELDDLKDLIKSYDDAFEAKRKMLELSLEKEEYELSKIKKHSQEYRDKMKEILELRKQGLTISKQEEQQYLKNASDYDKGLAKESNLVSSSSVTRTSLGKAYSGKYSEYVNKYAGQYNVDPLLIAAIIKQESGFNPNLKSKAGAMGLMQLMPSTAKQYGVKNAYDPEQNIKAGIQHFVKSLEKFNGNIELALKEYNAGSGNMNRYNNNPPFKETQEYSKKVLAYYQELTGGSSSINGTRKTSVSPSKDGSVQFAKQSSDYVKGATNINPYLLSILEKIAADKGKTITLTDGGRTNAQQANLKSRKPGLAASPGTSWHEYGLAVDVKDSWLRNMSDSELAKYGLHRPALSKGEDWHFEPLDTKGVKGKTAKQELTIKLAAEGGVSLSTGIENSLDLRNDYKHGAADERSKAIDSRKNQIQETREIEEGYYNIILDEMEEYNDKINERKALMEVNNRIIEMNPETSPEYRLALQSNNKILEEIQQKEHQKAEFLRRKRAEGALTDAQWAAAQEEIRKSGDAWWEAELTRRENLYKITDSLIKQQKEYTDEIDRQIEKIGILKSMEQEGSKKYNSLVRDELEQLYKKVAATEQDIKLNKQQQLNVKLLKGNIKELQKALEELEITNLRNKQSINSLIRDITDDVIDAYKQMYEKQKEAEIKAIDDEIDALEKSHDKKMKMYDEEIDKLSEIIQKRIELIDKEKEENDFQKRLIQAQKDKQNILNKLSALSLDDSYEAIAEKKRLSEELANKENEIADLQDDRSRELRKSALQDMLDKYKKDIDAKKKAEDEKYKAEKERLEKVKKDTEKHWDQLIESESWKSKIREQMLNGHYDQIIKDLDGFASKIPGIADKIGSPLETLLEKVKNLKDLLTELNNVDLNPPTVPAPANGKLLVDFLNENGINFTPDNKNSKITINGKTYDYGKITGAKYDPTTYRHTVEDEDALRQFLGLPARGNTGGSETVPNNTLLTDYLNSKKIQYTPDNVNHALLINGKSFKYGQIPGTRFDTNTSKHYITDLAQLKSALGIYHDGGIVSEKFTSKAKLLNDIFNVGRGEAAIKALEGELMIPPKNFDIGLDNIKQATMNVMSSITQKGGSSTNSIHAPINIIIESFNGTKQSIKELTEEVAIQFKQTWRKLGYTP